MSDENFAKGRDLVKTSNFDLFKMKKNSKVLTGIDPKDYERVVKSIASRLDFPSNLREAILENQYGDEGDEKVNDFSFKPGEESTFVFVRFVSLKQNSGKIDLAYAMYYLRFKFSPRIETKTEPKSLFSLPWRAPKEIQELKPVQLPEVDEDVFQCYFMAKAIKLFQKEYSGMLHRSG